MTPERSSNLEREFNGVEDELSRASLVQSLDSPPFLDIYHDSHVMRRNDLKKRTMVKFMQFRKRNKDTKKRDRETNKKRLVRIAREVEAIISESEFKELYFGEKKTLNTIADLKGIPSKKLWEWATSRFNLRGRGISLTDQNRLSLQYPDVAKEWHPTKNKPLTPADVSIGMVKKVWWLCSTCGYEWKAAIHYRIRNGCRTCAGKIVTDQNRLSLHYPEIAKDWHPTKNGKLRARDVSFGSRKVVWWLCSTCGYEWKVKVSARVHGRNCRACAGKIVTDQNRLSMHYPDIAENWHPA